MLPLQKHLDHEFKYNNINNSGSCYDNSVDTPIIISLSIDLEESSIEIRDGFLDRAIQ